ncbi:holo-ACP synthase [Anaerosinus massiliensis]|uniref:holo-ACP synthase n=1 Tax=Massilibacillus massiliensis TaxID=1806837 RepID=UPI000ACAC11B|nr:holo-ACP synthase [Massilibacillus massiliensis]
MIIGTGIDIVEIDRIEKALQNPRFIERVFTTKEIIYCKSRGAQASASYAARFAGKEAVLKAFGTGLRGGSLLDIEILPNEKGCPQVRLYRYFSDKAKQIGVTHIYISLSHARMYATAQAIFWGDID